MARAIAPILDSTLSPVPGPVSTVAVGVRPDLALRVLKSTRMTQGGPWLPDHDLALS
jgi:hypothetical protein